MTRIIREASRQAARRSSPARYSLVIFLVLWFAGCGTTTVIAPSSPAEPVPVFLLDHGRTSSLVLPAPDGTMTRYAYGDWRYYAERETGLGHAIAAVLWPTGSALGRRHLAGPATEASVRAQVRVPIQAIHGLSVEAARVAALRGRLDDYFESAEVRETPEVELSFVPYPHQYTLRHNSNAIIADWLVELGAGVNRRPIWSGWRVESR
ncbi:hypothetical protein [Thioalkalivibrio sulfidiphilus]|uniref:Lipoprotein n=1 Tax=Thioalkalivibrio sulfidiphilus (strain HL-EbGR7) TaxID=396588 RepID=B8GLQ2_THISH|nr:hypothetical protein [Thioalkalivibrio sulfidiphilus]ACL71655.1 conserved hypothetical protein [Thioalkalivibrio sulfidiphilus HL-EbGr7]